MDDSPSTFQFYNNQAVPRSTAMDANTFGPRRRIGSTHGSLHQRVHFPVGTTEDQTPKPLLAQRRRVLEFQRRWERIKTDLPPQLSRRHIGMISIGGVIGTGLFLGSGAALHSGGPVGALIGYSIIGTMVYCLCVSIGEMIAFLPNVGGIVGLADLYVDPAFGFSLGWAAWYNWSVTIPAEISAAVVLIGPWAKHIHIGWMTTICLSVATTINCFPSRVYGEFEYYFSAIKVLTIVCIIILSLGIDVGIGQPHAIWFSNWRKPFADEYLGITGSTGRFLGFWAVLMQASFSFFGSEVPGIAAGEVIDATRNVPRALRRVWIRITLFYIGGIFCAGLLVDSNNRNLTSPANTGTSASSPFVIAFRTAGLKWMSQVVNGAALLSAWSAAASDVYISSRFLFFLARCHHAPQIFASLIRYPSKPQQKVVQSHSDEDSGASDGGYGDDGDDECIDINVRARPGTPVEVSDDEYFGKDEHPKPDRQHLSPGITVTVTPASASTSMEDLSPDAPLADGPRDDAGSDANDDVEQGSTPKEKRPWFVLPLFAVLGSASVGGIAFLNISKAGGVEVFNWLVAVASVASLQSWAAMLFTYIRWHQGTMYAENLHKNNTHDGEDLTAHPQKEEIEHSRTVIAQIKRIRIHRHWGQPYLAYWAFSICMIILFTNGWTVFLHTGWKIADIPGAPTKNYGSDEHISGPIANFLSSYIPIPVFFLLTFGYKLIYQTKMVSVEEMDFSQGFVDDEAQQDPPYKSTRRRILGWLLVN